VLGVDEYRQAYNSGPYRQLFDKLWGQSRLVFVGFGFSDPWLDFIVDSVITQTAASSTSSPQHIAIIGLKQSEDYSTERRRNFRDSYNADPLFYPIIVAPNGAEDHSVLLEVLEALGREDGTIRPNAERQGAEAEAKRKADEQRRYAEVEASSCSPPVASQFRDLGSREPNRSLEVPPDEWDYPSKFPIPSWLTKFFRER
jgi:SIR2-like domain